jgi:hypothetical protein
MGVSGQRHAPAALYPWGKNPWYPLIAHFTTNQKMSLCLLKSHFPKVCWFLVVGFVRRLFRDSLSVNAFLSSAASWRPIWRILSAGSHLCLFKIYVNVSSPICLVRESQTKRSPPPPQVQTLRLAQFPRRPRQKLYRKEPGGGGCS